MSVTAADTPATNPESTADPTTVDARPAVASRWRLGIVHLFQLKRVKSRHDLCRLDDAPRDLFVDDARGQRIAQPIEVIVVIPPVVLEKADLPVRQIELLFQGSG